MRVYKRHLPRFVLIGFFVWAITGSMFSIAAAEEAIADCRCTARGELANGDTFFGYVVPTFPMSESEGRWMHLVSLSEGTPRGVLVGTIDNALCRPNGVIRVDAEGTGLYTGIPVNFRLTFIDYRLPSNPSYAYRVEIFDALSGALLYTNSPSVDLVAGQISCEYFR